MGGVSLALATANKAPLTVGDSISDGVELFWGRTTMDAQKKVLRTSHGFCLLSHGRGRAQAQAQAQRQGKEQPSTRAIVFAERRDAVELIVRSLREAPECQAPCAVTDTDTVAPTAGGQRGGGMAKAKAFLRVSRFVGQSGSRAARQGTNSAARLSTGTSASLQRLLDSAGARSRLMLGGRYRGAERS